ncbi:MAG: DNA internalization-related competence protein ComEC/Rec2 [Desulfovibrionaceae bacterium]
MNKNIFPTLLPYQYYGIVCILSFSIWKYDIASLCLIALFLYFFKQKESLIYTILIAIVSYCFAHYFFYQTHTKPSWYSNNAHYLIQAHVDQVTYLSEKRQRILLKDITALEYVTFQRINKKRPCTIPLDGRYLYSTKQFCVTATPILSTDTIAVRAVWTLKDSNVKIVQGQNIEGIFQLSNIHGSKNNNTFDIESYWKENNVYYRARLKTDISQVHSTGTKDLTTQFREFLHNRLYTVLLLSRNNNLEENSFQKYRETMSYAIIEALLFGNRYSFSSDVEKILIEATLFHSLVLSGMHLSCLFIFSYCIVNSISFFYPRFFFFIPKQKALILFIIPFAIFYAVLSAFPLSFTRALTMLIIGSIFFYYNSTNTLFDTLFLTLITLLIYDPSLLFSLSLQFSILSVFAIYCSLPITKRIITLCIRYIRFPLVCYIVSSILSILCISFAIQLFLLPLILSTFGTIPYFFVLNILWLPILSLFLLPSLIFAYILTLCGFLSLASYIFSYSSEIIMYLLELLYFLRSHAILFPLLDMRPHWMTTISFILALYALISFYTQNNKKYIHAAVISIIMLSIPILFRYKESIDPSLKIQILDVGHGQAIVVEHEGKRMLIDAGATSPTFDIGERILTPYLTYNKKAHLDALLISHQDNDHVGGAIYLLKTFSIKDVYYNGDHAISTGTIKRFISLLHTTKRQTHIVGEGDIIPFTKNLYFEVLAPTKTDISTRNSNANSIVIGIVFNNKRIALILGDQDNKGQKFLVDNYIKETEDIPIIIMPHHGSKNNFYAPLYTKGKRTYAIASTNKLDNNYLPETMKEFLHKENISLLTTFTNGAIYIQIQDDIISVETERMSSQKNSLLPFI